MLFCNQPLLLLTFMWIMVPWLIYQEIQLSSMEIWSWWNKSLSFLSKPASYLVILFSSLFWRECKKIDNFFLKRFVKTNNETTEQEQNINLNPKVKNISGKPLLLKAFSPTQWLKTQSLLHTVNSNKLNHQQWKVWHRV